MAAVFAKLIVTFFTDDLDDENFDAHEKAFYAWWDKAELIADPPNLRVEFDSE